MKAYERLIKYTKVNTASSEGGNTTPSTRGSLSLRACWLMRLKELGVKDARVDDKCYVYGIIPASAGCRGGEARVYRASDTSPDFRVKVNPG